MEEAISDATLLQQAARASQLRRRVAIRERRHSSNGVSLPLDALPEELGALRKARQDTPRLQGFRIRCGRAERPTVPDASHRPISLPHLASRALKRKFSDDASAMWRPSNGCGELLDADSYPSSTLGAWIASQPCMVAPIGDELLGSLPEANLPTTRLPLGRLASGCGCVRRAVACMACGNVLGTALEACGKHIIILDTSSDGHRPVFRFLYTLFPSRITPSPDFTIATRDSAPVTSESSPLTSTHQSAVSVRSPQSPSFGVREARLRGSDFFRPTRAVASGLHDPSEGRASSDIMDARSPSPPQPFPFAPDVLNSISSVLTYSSDRTNAASFDEEGLSYPTRDDAVPESRRVPTLQPHETTWNRPRSQVPSVHDILVSTRSPSSRTSRIYELIRARERLESLRALHDSESNTASSTYADPDCDG